MLRYNLNIHSSMWIYVHGPQIAFINDGGLRSDIEAGDITAEDVLSVLPFNNTVDLVELSGEDIIKVDKKCRSLCGYLLSSAGSGMECCRAVSQHVLWASRVLPDGWHEGGAGGGSWQSGGQSGSGRAQNWFRIIWATGGWQNIQCGHYQLPDPAWKVPCSWTHEKENSWPNWFWCFDKAFQKC